MIEKIQAVCKLLGHAGCNAFSDLQIAELAQIHEVDVLEVVSWAIANGFIQTLANGPDREAFIPSEEAHLAIMKRASGVDWKTKLVDITYVCKPGEFEKLQFGMGSYDHFVVGDGSGKVLWDSEGDLIARTPSAILKGKRIFWF